MEEKLPTIVSGTRAMPEPKGSRLMPKSPGRPKGAKSKTNQIIEALEKELGTPKTLSNLRKVFQQTIRQALEGDVACQKILWDRFMPVSRFEKGAGSQAPMINITIGSAESTLSTPHIKVEPINNE